MIYEGMWNHLNCRSFLLNYFAEKQKEQDGWVNESDLVIDATISKEYYRRFLQYINKDDVYTELVQPIAKSIVNLFTPDLTDQVRSIEPDTLFQILKFSILQVSPEGTGHSTFYERLMATEFDHELTEDQISSVQYDYYLLQVLHKNIRPIAIELVSLLQNQSEDTTKEKSIDYLITFLQRHYLLNIKGLDGKTIIQSIVELEIDQETEFSLLSKILDKNEQHFQHILEVLFVSEVLELRFKRCSYNALLEIRCQIFDKVGCQPGTAISELIDFYLSGELSTDRYDRIMKLLSDIKFYLPNEIVSFDRESLLHEILATQEADFRTPEKMRNAIKSIFDGFLLKNIRQKLQDEYDKQTTNLRKANNQKFLVREPNRTFQSIGEVNDDLDQSIYDNASMFVEFDYSFVDAETESRIITNFNKKRPILQKKFGEKAVRFIEMRLHCNDEKVLHKEFAEILDCSIKHVEYIKQKLRKNQREIERLLGIKTPKNQGA